jgi:hypothetical protein
MGLRAVKIVFWDVMPYTVVDVSIVLEEPGATIFRVP